MGIRDEGRTVDVLLGREMVEHGTSGDPGALRNVIDGDVVNRLFDRQLDGGTTNDALSSNCCW